MNWIRALLLFLVSLTAQSISDAYVSAPDSQEPAVTADPAPLRRGRPTPGQEPAITIDDARAQESQ